MLRDAATRVSVQQFLQVYRNARALSADPALGLRIGARLRVSSYGLYGYALLCMPSLREAIAFGLRYAALAGFMTEMHFANTAAMHAVVMGPQCVPARLQVVGAAPPHAALYREHLRCPVEFEQTSNTLYYPACWLDRAPLLASPLAAAALLQSCTTLLAELQRASGVAGCVARALADSPGEFADVEALAARLHMSSRTLRRRLKAEGTSYQQLLADVRRALAIDYPKNTAMSSEDIAEAPGFSDAASLRRAFRRWTAKSPSEFRQPAQVPGGSLQGSSRAVRNQPRSAPWPAPGQGSAPQLG